MSKLTPGTRVRGHIEVALRPAPLPYHDREKLEHAMQMHRDVTVRHPGGGRLVSTSFTDLGMHLITHEDEDAEGPRALYSGVIAFDDLARAFYHRARHFRLTGRTT